MRALTNKHFIEPALYIVGFLVVLSLLAYVTSAAIGLIFTVTGQTFGPTVRIIIAAGHAIQMAVQ